MRDAARVMKAALERIAAFDYKDNWQARCARDALAEVRAFVQVEREAEEGERDE